MHVNWVRQVFVAVCGIGPVSILSTGCAPHPFPDRIPEQGWAQYADPADAGWSEAGLERARSLASATGSGAVFVVQDGAVVAAWGAVTHRWKLYSVRKTVVGSLFGRALEDGRVSLGDPVAAWGLDTLAALDSLEATATVAQLLSTSSGIYLPAAKEPAGTDDRRPARGSAGPGTAWWYNNWDFNATAWVLALACACNPLDWFASEVAAPIGMEDYRAGDAWWEREPRRTPIPGFDFRMSTRDLARFGLLYLREGRWSGRSVIPGAWVGLSTQAHADPGGGAGYGYLWWIDGHRWLDAGSDFPRLQAVRDLSAVGTGGQMLVVIPEYDLLIVHRGDTDRGRSVPDADALRVVEAVLAARTGPAHPGAELGALRPEPFPHDAPPPTERSVDRAIRVVAADYEGRYVPERGPPLTVFGEGNGLFVGAPGLPSAELFAESSDVFFARSVDVTLRFERDAEGMVVAIDATLPGLGRVRAARRP